MVTTHERARHSFFERRLGRETEATFITTGNKGKKGKKESLVTLSWPDDGQAYGSCHPTNLDLRAQIRSCWRWKLSLCPSSPPSVSRSVPQAVKVWPKFAISLYQGVCLCVCVRLKLWRHVVLVAFHTRSKVRQLNPNFCPFLTFRLVALR
jgi:hypothetical protein